MNLYRKLVATFLALAASAAMGAAFPDPLQVADTGLTVINRDTLIRLGGVPLQVTRTEFNKVLADERTRITNNSVGIFTAGDRIRILTEVGERIWVVGTGGTDAQNAAASHLRTVSLPGGSTIVLAGDANTVTATTGPPASGTGANGDVAVDRAANAFYTKAAGVWSLTDTLFPASTTSKVASVAAANAAAIASPNTLGSSYAVGAGAPYAFWRNDGFTTAPSRLIVSGAQGVGNVLTAVFPAGQTGAVQWYRDSGAGPTAISGATASTYTQVLADVGATITAQASAITATTFPQRSMYGQTIRRGGGANDSANAPAGSNVQTMATADRPFTHARFIFSNWDTSNTNTLRCKAVPSATFGSAPSVTTPTDVTVAGSTTITVPTGTAGTDSNNKLAGFVVSDPIAIASIPRTDGGSGYLIALRCYSAGVQNWTLTNSSFTTNYATEYKVRLGGGRDHGTWYNTGADAVTTWNTSYSLSMFGALQNVAIQTFATTPSTEFALFGDSQARGFATTSGFNSSALTVARLGSTEQTPISALVFGSPSMGTQYILANELQWLSAYQPQICAFQVYSTNDGIAQAAFDNAKTRALAFIQAAVAKGCVPILLGTYPYQAHTTTSEGYVIDLHNWIRAQGYDYLIIYNDLGDGASPQRLQSQYSADGTHLNDAGRIFEGTKLLQVIQAIKARLGLAFLGDQLMPPLAANDERFIKAA